MQKLEELWWNALPINQRGQTAAYGVAVKSLVSSSHLSEQVWDQAVDSFHLQRQLQQLHFLQGKQLKMVFFCFVFLNKIWTLICMAWRLSLWVSGSSKPSPFQVVVKSLSVKVYFFLTRNKGTLPTKRFFYPNCALLFTSPGILRQPGEPGGDGRRRAVLRVHAQVVDKLPTVTLWQVRLSKDELWVKKLICSQTRRCIKCSLPHICFLHL